MEKQYKSYGKQLPQDELEDSYRERQRLANKIKRIPLKSFAKILQGNSYGLGLKECVGLHTILKNNKYKLVINFHEEDWEYSGFLKVKENNNFETNWLAKTSNLNIKDIKQKIVNKLETINPTAIIHLYGGQNPTIITLWETNVGITKKEKLVNSLKEQCKVCKEVCMEYGGKLTYVPNGTCLDEDLVECPACHKIFIKQELLD